MSNNFFNIIRSGDINKVKESLESDKNIINAKDKQGRSPLMEAILCKKENIVKYLIESGANINEQDNNGWCALHFAAQEFLIATTQLLLEKEAKIDLQDSNGNSPLLRSLFSSQGRGDIITLLLSAGANKDLKNHSGVSPYALANQVTNFNLLQYFE